VSEVRLTRRGGVRVHRGVLQSDAPAYYGRQCKPGEVRDCPRCLTHCPLELGRFKVTENGETRQTNVPVDPPIASPDEIQPYLIKMMHEAYAALNASSRANDAG